MSLVGLHHGWEGVQASAEEAVAGLWQCTNEQGNTAAQQHRPFPAGQRSRQDRDAHQGLPSSSTAVAFTLQLLRRRQLPAMVP